jgi:POT family proton-dependent oligopeptide transporter
LTLVPPDSPARPAPTRWPASIKYIVGNEACERFSFYGMRGILTVFLVEHLLARAPLAARPAEAKEIFHLFVMGVYFFPLLGGYLADRFWGKYRTIFWLSLVYCAGHACLALFEDSPSGFYTGLVLIALGSGGIKPCVSAFVGDQLGVGQKALVSRVFAAFYWSINVGSLLASLLIPKLLKLYGAKVAFGLPGVLMFIATVVFWLGRAHYHELPPSGPSPHSFWRVMLTARNQPHPPEAVEGARAVVRILRIFAFVPFFWMLFDQKASAWVLQARRLDLAVGPITFEASQLQFVNPAVMLLLLPLASGLVYPALERTRFRATPLRRMTVGMFVAGLSFVMIAGIQVALDRGLRPSVLWQLLPYLALTTAEVLISVTGLEFAYTQAPPQMKGVIQSLWYLAVSAGNLVVALLARINVLSGPGSEVGSFLFYAALVCAAGIGMGLVSRGYVGRAYFRQE